MICSFPRQTIQHHSGPGLCLNHYCQRKSWSWPVVRRSIRPRTNTKKKKKKKSPFHHRRVECKSRNSRDTWSNRKVWPESTKWRAKANRVFSRECMDHSKHSLPTTHGMTLHMDITRWSIPKSDWLYSLQLKMEKLYMVSKNKTWSWLWLR